VIEKDSSIKHHSISVRVLQTDFEALQAAAKAYRIKTGELVTVSDLMRWGSAVLTAQVGFPMSEGPEQ